ncbi:hypothetical protein K469DRAFT_728723 [Zopfia rhizophila CBS 207.26]|uniref:Glyoxalase-like domain-containing protein n=1 Tax=Zopfia rhizophila CBS 207.26 TaxID=1314779 RepID=A0A6A6ERA0_9PEZI|nr:hypothetical protein K469DRAFT_728723 [Zopfia rhizophila CBS 207.26]
MPPFLDHLILFLPSTPHQTPLLPPSLTHSFTLTPGGRHAGNLTANTLILLSDGCYIELISFITSDPSLVASHWWGPDPARRGWTDWCLITPGTSASENYKSISETHATPVSGGRKRPDGKEVTWSVTFPSSANGGQAIRGKIPFFCHDTTPRDLRVPLSDESTTHPCGAFGVKSFTVILKGKEDVETTAGTYSKMFGVEGEKKGDEVVFKLGRVNEVEGLGGGPSVVLRTARDKVEESKVKGKGFWFGDVVLAAKGKEGEVGKKERVDIGEDDVEGLWIEYV